VGDATVQSACERVNTNPHFLLAILNTYLFDDYFPEKMLKSFSVAEILDYLSKTDRYYVEFQLPNIERHFSSLILHNSRHNPDHEESDDNLSLLRRFFFEMSRELENSIEYDRTELFPLLESFKGDDMPASVDKERVSRYEVSREVEEKLSDLISFFVIHLNGCYDQNLCRAVVVALFTLCKDIKQNNRIRERILVPMLQLL
jgi:regulator of cell morphogenesis and NO signaling